VRADAEELGIDTRGTFADAGKSKADVVRAASRYRFSCALALVLKREREHWDC
jgi:hypothetical protein